MPEGYTYTLASTVAVLAAVDVPFPVELSALAMVGFVLRWALARQNKAHDQHEDRLSKVEEQLRVKSTEKHALANQITALRTAVKLIIPTAEQCTCGSMERLLPTLHSLATDPKESMP